MYCRCKYVPELKSQLNLSRFERNPKPIWIRSEADPNLIRTWIEPDSNLIRFRPKYKPNPFRVESNPNRPGPTWPNLDQDFPKYRRDLDLIRARIIQVVNVECYLQQSIFYSNFHVSDFHNSLTPCTMAVMVLMAMTKISFAQNLQFMIENDKARLIYWICDVARVTWCNLIIIINHKMQCSHCFWRAIFSHYFHIVHPLRSLKPLFKFGIFLAFIFVIWMKHTLW